MTETQVCTRTQAHFGARFRRVGSRRTRVLLSMVLISAGLYAVGVSVTAHSEVDEGRVFGSCVWVLPGVDACRDDDGTLTVGDGLGVDGLPLVWVEGLLA